MNNQQLAEIFYRIANLLEIKGEVIYKVLAYRRAADNLSNLSQDVNELWHSGDLTTVPGIGKAIADKIDELLTSGKLDFLDRLQAEIPVSLVEMLQVPDLGPKKVSLFWKQAGITNLVELEEAARSRRLRDLPGMGEKSEAKVLAGVLALQRRTQRIPLAKAWPLAQRILAELRRLPDVLVAEAAGSLRRMQATIGNVDLLVSVTDSKPVMEAFTRLKDVTRVLSQGEIESSVEFMSGLQAQLWAHPPESFGTALQYATGSKDHNLRLKELAQNMGLSLSDKSIQKPDGIEILCANEQQVYATLGLPWILPELREDRGEVQAARIGNLPDLIELAQIRSELHVHTNWSDGANSIQEMAEAALRRGYQVLAITDHSTSLGIARGLSIDDLRSQQAEIKAVQDKMGDAILLLQGTEVEVHSDGSLDFSDEVLQSLDVVIAAVHVGLRQPREIIMPRILRAMQNPHIDILSHPTGRLIPDREGADLDMDVLLEAAARYGVALEINANPQRLDLDDIYARKAVELGAKLCINTDAHMLTDLDLMHFGVSTARRGWVNPDAVLNTWEVSRLSNWLKARGSR